MEWNSVNTSELCGLARNANGRSCWDLFTKLFYSRCSHVGRLDFQSTHNVEILVFASSRCELDGLNEKCKTQFYGKHLRLLVSFGPTTKQKTVSVKLHLRSSSSHMLFFADRKKDVVFECSHLASSSKKDLLTHSIEFFTGSQAYPSLAPVTIEATVCFDGLSRSVVQKDSISISIPVTEAEPRNANGVFVSYAWNHKSAELQSTSDDLETPVNAIIDSFKQRSGIRVIYDKLDLTAGEYLTDFLTLPSSESTAVFVAVVSEKYWRSWYCMKEFVTMLETFSKSPRNEKDSMLMIGHPSSLTETVGDIDNLLQYWRSDEVLVKCPSILKSECQQLRTLIVHVIEFHLARICNDLQGGYRRWRQTDMNEIISWLNSEVERRVGAGKV